MYDISLQYENPSFAARNNIHIYGDNLSMYYYLPIRTCIFDLMVGVSNDAVNFLNSGCRSKGGIF